MGPLGMGEIVVLFILALLIFGPKKLPELGKTFGKGMAEFKRASNELKSTFRREIDTIEQETKDVKDVAGDVQRDINRSYYDDSEDDYYNDYDYGGDAGTSGAGGSPADGTASSGGEAQSAASANGNSAAAAQADGEADSGSRAAETASDQPVSGVPETDEADASKSA